MTINCVPVEGCVWGARSQLLNRSTVRRVAGGVAFDQAYQLLSQILRVVAGALQGLGHQQDLEGGSILRQGGIGQVFSEKRVADLGELRVPDRKSVGSG